MRPPRHRSLAAALLAALALAGSAAAAPGGPMHEGAAAFARGRLEVAAAHFVRATTARPGDPQGWLWLGVTRFYQGDHAAGERALARAARLAPRDATVLLWWGHLLARVDRPDAAAAAFRRALDLRASPTVHALARQAARALGPLPIAPALAAPAGAGLPGAAPAWVHDVASYRGIALHYNPRLSGMEADAIARALLGYSREFNVDPRLVVALVVVESGFQPRAVSRAGAMGLGQLMPGTARALGVNPWDPVQNLYGSIRYLRGNLDRFGWDRPHLALAAYNAGRGAVERHEGIPPYAETQWYVVNVSSLYRRLLAASGEMPELR
ncbi:MAG: lytic transglycosylase domain-containing protein [Armatimonadota bacterium]|nr:lytic transglycosylase domain-containing protein [Armatimonadota bacterium]MDR7421783.1 lytic transglycosylase domain-containing protein [Armatimonadota bacterium]MDR7454119.1 lytic transglycosylase domain-containing protein [Armatimonadota bacterium]MDR7458077.1 lytic transglycosylase domain-containing protein [Armatimonadota bacterium]